MSLAKASSYMLYEKNLPQAFDGFKIAHISDLHSVPAEGIFEAVKENTPDIIAVTGDLVHDNDKPYDKTISLMEKLSSLAPIYAVTGNHDLWRPNHNRIIKEIEDANVTFLRNEMVKLSKNGSEIALFGMEDPFSKIPDIIAKNVADSYAQLPEYDGFGILLFHRANLFDLVKDFGFDLILSGHMHGGQVRLPLIGGVCGPTSAILSKSGMLFPKYTAGIYNNKNTSMVVNRGVGNTLPVPRFGNPPDVGIVTLHRQNETAY
ncbi:MAG: metallophosphoesterase [Ruminococcaceae bacterium]|nr:metallophosphoesterase [Oscillospiraceae bacterium]